MWIKKITIKEPPNIKEISLHPKVNLIHSKDNSFGKSTLLRFILHGLGFSIPNLEKIQMEKCYVTIIVMHDDVPLIVHRHESDIVIEEDGKTSYYHIPGDIIKARSHIFHINNEKLLESLLGSMYIDQERGWTLLNRGKVIGSNNFQIDLFLNAIAKDDLESLLFKKESLNKELKKYKQLQSLTERQKTFDDFDKKRINLSGLETIQIKLDTLNVQLKALKKEEKRIVESIKDNNRFINYIDQMKLLIHIDGKDIPLTHDMIVSCPDNMDFLNARLDLSHIIINKLEKQIDDVEIQLNQLLNEGESDNIVEAYSIIPVSKLNIDSEKIQSSINLMKKELSRINAEIESSQDKATISEELDSIITRNLTELNVLDSIKDASRPLCKVNKLKSYSGTDYRKIIMSYRLAYASLIEEKEGLTIPIIIDSPCGEVDDTNIDKMMNLLTRHYSNHQIIIASIDLLDSLNKDLIVELNTKKKLIDKNADEGMIDYFIE